MLASQGFWGTKGEQIKMLVKYHYDFNKDISKNRIPLSPPLLWPPNWVAFFMAVRKSTGWVGYNPVSGSGMDFSGNLNIC